MPDSLIKPFEHAKRLAQTAQSPAEVMEVLKDIEQRLGEANSAIAVDSARMILQALIRSLEVNRA